MVRVRDHSDVPQNILRESSPPQYRFTLAATRMKISMVYNFRVYNTQFFLGVLPYSTPKKGLNVILKELPRGSTLLLATTRTRIAMNENV